MQVALPILVACAAPQDSAVGPPEPLPPLPSARQLAWHERPFYGFVHFGPNTFTGVEWGEGREDPDVFAPSDLDCRQWVAAMKAAGMEGVILTAKHHDGFCLFPSDHTEHDVASSAWRDGKGDVLGELAEACRAGGLELGVYLSPWDRHEPTYGTGAPYNAHFREQLREALSRYGPLFEVWFDGACGEGPNGERQVYDWPSFVGVVRELQPDACIFSDAGPDVRWVGNERGYAAETNWCFLRRGEVYPGYADHHELTEGHADGTHWVPAECDVSIRPGWFWRAGLDDEVESVDALLDIWYGSIGRGANLLLNCPPDDRGRLPDVDVRRLAALGGALRATFDEDLLRAAAASGDGFGYAASNVRGSDEAAFGPAALLDPERATYWATDDDVTEAWIELRFAKDVAFDRVWVEEAIQLGQRVRAWRLDVPVEGAWRTVAEGTTIGARRVVRTEPTTARKLRLVVEDARACPALSRLSLYRAPARVALAPAGGLHLGPVRVHADAGRAGVVLRHTLDGSDPTGASPVVEGGVVAVAASGRLSVRAFEDGRPSPFVARGDYTIVGEEDLREAVVFVRKPEAGLRFTSYAGEEGEAWTSVDGITGATPLLRGMTDDVGLERRPPRAPAALAFDGFLLAPADGVYTFATRADDGVRLTLHDEVVVDDDGPHGAREARGQVALRAGYHPFRLEWFDAGGDAALELRWRTPGTRELVPIPSSAYAR